MDINIALDFLRTHVEVALATSEDNVPSIRIFQIMKIEGTTLYFATSPKKDVWRQLTRNPRIEILATYEQVMVRCKGVASFDVDTETARWIFEHNAVLPRLYDSYDQLSYFRMDIAELDYYDLRPTPPLFRHFNLRDHTEDSGFVGTKYSRRDA